MTRKFSFLLWLACLPAFAYSQQVTYKWWNPQSESSPVLEGQAWPQEAKAPYDRLPARAEGKVTDAVWGLSHQSAGLMVRFRTDAAEIKVRYIVEGKHALPHMPATGVSGVDLYGITSDGLWRWCAARYSFGDTITFNYQNLDPTERFHKKGREYRLYLPLYNSVKWLEIGVPETKEFVSLPVRPDKPIVVYGTSIAQGACASRPGMAWPAILGRKLDAPLINLGFSGNGRLDKAVIDMLAELDPKAYVIDCLPNLTIRNNPKTDLTPDEIFQRVTYAVETLRAAHPSTPIVLAEHAGYTDELISPVSKGYYTQVNEILRKAFESLITKGVRQVYLIPREDFDLNYETTVDGTHPTDLGMMNVALGYEKHLRKILNEPVGSVSTTQPVTQLREISNYDWQKRHRDILALNASDPPQTVVIGNSITHFWGGIPAGHRITSNDAWSSTFGAEGVRNMGYGWDRIENVLWRAYHGELDGYQAKRIFVSIGTNNLDFNNDAEIAQGWDLLIQAIRNRQPQAKLYMMGIYPRRQKEERVRTLNRSLEALASKHGVNFIDPGKVFLKKDGTIDEAFFSDGLHPNAKGYEKLGAAIRPFAQK